MAADIVCGWYPSLSLPLSVILSLFCVVWVGRLTLLPPSIIVVYLFLSVLFFFKLGFIDHSLCVSLSLSLCGLFLLVLFQGMGRELVCHCSHLVNTLSGVKATTNCFIVLLSIFQTTSPHIHSPLSFPLSL